MEAWLSWALILALGGAAYLYYGNKGTKGRPRGRTLQRAADSIKAKEEAALDWVKSEGTAKAPAKAAKPAKAKAPRKSVKKAVQEVGQKVEATLSTTSSNAGADGDDDLSPAVSPSVGTNVKAPSGKDVSDMLEDQGTGPSVLRLTPTTQSARTKNVQQKRDGAAQQENKKQRQNKKKAEEAKALREEQEKSRQVLLEQQRRVAREARGEPARNGLQSSKAPSTNAWTNVRSKSGAPGTNQPAGGARDGHLLDTFDPDVASIASSSENATNGTSATPDSLGNSAQWANLPSEEEQLRMAMADSEWTTVPKGKKTRKTKTNVAGDTGSEHGSESNVPQSPVRKTTAPPPEKIKPRSVYDALQNAEPASQASHPLDSDWPVV